MLCKEMTRVMCIGVGDLLTEEEIMALCSWHQGRCSTCNGPFERFQPVPDDLAGDAWFAARQARRAAWRQHRDGLCKSARLKLALHTKQSEPNTILCTELLAIARHGAPPEVTAAELHALFDFHWLQEDCATCSAVPKKRTGFGRPWNASRDGGNPATFGIKLRNKFHRFRGKLVRSARVKLAAAQ